MRIAIPVTDGKIANHPGHCQVFLVADVEGGAVVKESEHKNPGHGPNGPPPVFLAGLGVQEVLAWGMPDRARNIFANLGLKVHLGATGEPRQALRAFLAGTLERTTEGLDGGGSCGGHGHDHDHHH